jgi:ribosomal protein S12 methylthiotransferase RimO
VPPAVAPRRVALVTLGCARNDVDSEELAARLTAGGWQLVDEAADATAVVVNTCGFVAAAKKDSVDELLAAADAKAAGVTKAVVAVGCLAERYGVELARALPEADAVLGFDDYAALPARLEDLLAGRPVPAHRPRDRRTLLPLAPAERASAAGRFAVPGHGGSPGVSTDLPSDLPEGVAPQSGPRPLRRRLTGGPVAPLKLASGCDRRCSFCAIPSFRGAFVSRPPADVLAEASWLAAEGVRELVLVSENSTSYGKDLGDLRLLEALLPELAAIDGIARVRVSYLQPAEMRRSLVEVMAGTPGVAPYFDLSFQHASAEVLRRMRRFGDTARFLGLLDDVRAAEPQAGARSNVIAGFPGERKADVAELERFLVAARLDAVGVFGYSDEDGTEAARLPGKVRADAVRRRVERVTRLAEELTAARAAERIGTEVDVVVESVSAAATGTVAEGRAAHQAPEVDGSTTVAAGAGLDRLAVGDVVRVRVTGSDGVDLTGSAVRVVSPATRKSLVDVG